MTYAQQQQLVKRQHTALLLILIHAYVIACLVLRWMSPSPLFVGNIFSQQWPQPPLVEMAYLVYMSCLPVALWMVTLTVLTVRLPRIFSAPFVVMLVFVALVVIELDLTWYAAANRHVNLSEGMFLFTDATAGYGGLGQEQMAFHLRRVAKHAGALGLFYWLARNLVSRSWFPSIPPLATTRLVGVLVALSSIDALVVGYQRGQDKLQWAAVSEQNPLRLSFVDRAVAGAFRLRDGNLDAANQALSELRQRTPAGRSARRLDDEQPVNRSATLRASREDFRNVLLITVESFSPRYVNDETMPFWSRFSRRGVSLANHYSTGNNSEHGILGLLYGAAPFFYQGGRFPGVARTSVIGSPYIDAFNQHGYQTKSIAAELGGWDQIGKYFVNFTRPSVRAMKREYEAPQQDWDLIPILLQELRGKEPQFLHAHYWSTHFAYTHSAKYNAFQPEVPDDFIYGPDMRERIPEIVNRYKNCLRELDDWLKAVLTNVDLASTIVVITGDHGEEFFENGRFIHGNALDEPQTRTPFLLYIPGLEGRVLDEVTSHADLMPTLLDVFGWEDDVPRFGQSVFAGTSDRSALVSNRNHPFAPNQWAVVTKDAKSIVSGQAGSPLEIVALYGHSDSPATFRADSAEWRQHLGEILKYEKLLSLGSSLLEEPSASSAPLRETQRAAPAGS